MMSEGRGWGFLLKVTDVVREEELTCSSFSGHLSEPDLTSTEWIIKTKINLI